MEIFGIVSNLRIRLKLKNFVALLNSRETTEKK